MFYNLNKLIRRRKVFMVGKEFNEKIYRLNDKRDKFLSLFDKIEIMQILIQKDGLTPEEKATFILSLNQLTKTIVKDAIDNQNEAYDLLKSEGMEGTQADIQQIFDSMLEDIVANSNQLNRVRTELKNKKEPE